MISDPFGLSSYSDETPIFVVGLPRSGSTLVEQMLSTHTMVWGAGEKSYEPGKDQAGRKLMKQPFRIHMCYDTPSWPLRIYLVRSCLAAR